jgi:hypothetical protein
MPNTVRWAGTLAIAATLSYCWAIWWLAGLLSVLAPADGLPRLSVVLLAPLPGTFWLHSIHWQALALVSLGLALRSTFGREALMSARDSTVAPLLGHAFYLFLICCLHLVGLLASVVGFAAVIG